MTLHRPVDPVSASPETRLGLQLYTVRDAAAADLHGVLRWAAAAGYAGVETIAAQGLAPTELARLLDDHELEWVSDFTAYQHGDEFVRELDALAEGGCRDVVLPVLDLGIDPFSDRDALAKAVVHLNQGAETAGDRGIAIGYHNHYWEFGPIDGQPALLRLYADLDPRVFAEVDIYWVQVAGVDPVGVVAALGTRARRLHVKDGPARDPSQAMVAVGDGSVDIAGVLRAAPHAEWHVVELDECDSDVFEAVKASARFLLAHELTRGRR